MINDLIKLSNHLDSKGRKKESDYLDGLIHKMSADEAEAPRDWSDDAELATEYVETDLLANKITKALKKTTLVNAYDDEQCGGLKFAVDLSPIIMYRLKVRVKCRRSGNLPLNEFFSSDSSAIVKEAIGSALSSYDLTVDRVEKDGEGGTYQVLVRSMRRAPAY